MFACIYRELCYSSLYLLGWYLRERGLFARVHERRFTPGIENCEGCDKANEQQR